MDVNSTFSPPVNNALVPDIYNRLDADVIERTRVVNNQLSLRLHLKQKIISKYKHEAERFLLLEKSRLARELARITTTLPSAASLQDLDARLAKKRSQAYLAYKHKKTNYLATRNEDLICRRCYIHHLPTKKKFYSFKMHSLPPPPSSVLIERAARSEPYNQKSIENMESSKIKDNRTAQVFTKETYSDVEDVYDLDIQDQTFADKLVPAVEAFKFLEREKWGRERDLNHSLTPRLMPNEMWKHVVKNICSQGSIKAPNGTPPNSKHGVVNGVTVREKTVERNAGIRSRAHSIMSHGTVQGKTESRNLTKSNSKISLFRRQSVVGESNDVSEVR